MAGTERACRLGFTSSARRTSRGAHHRSREESMKTIVLAVSLSLIASSAFATCKGDAESKKLACAALKSFMSKCEKDANATCGAYSSSKKLAGAAKPSHMKKCVSDAVGS